MLSCVRQYVLQGNLARTPKTIKKQLIPFLPYLDDIHKGVLAEVKTQAAVNTFDIYKYAQPLNTDKTYNFTTQITSIDTHM